MKEQEEVEYLFYGDSITEWWDLDKFLSNGKRIVNRAIAGDRTRYMLYRFDGDCVQLKPKKIVFMGGINDLRAWYFAGDYTVEMSDKQIIEEILGNIFLMNSKAKVNGIEFIVGSILPINEGIEIYNDKINEKVRQINEKLQEFCKREKLIYLDYYNEVLEKNTNKINREFTIDGLHPNNEGYLELTKILKKKLNF